MRVFFHHFVPYPFWGPLRVRYQGAPVILYMNNLYKYAQFEKISQTIAQKVSNSLRQKTETPFNPDQVNLHPILEKDSKNRVTTRSQALEAQEKAEKEQLDINDLATTLLVVLVTSKRLAAMQIGDGFIVFKPLGGNYQLLFQPDKGEYINETTFVTSSNALEDMQIKVLTEPVAFICVATDGVEKVSINYKNWQPFPPFFQPLEEYLQQTETPLQEDLEEFLEREDLNKLTTDDKTLLLAFCSETGFV